jgi:uncharacterized protein (TIGR03083 family)
MRHREWSVLAAAEQERLLALLRELSPDDWERPTDCAGWAVRDIVAHLAGAFASAASPREGLRQQRAGKPRAQGRDLIDGINDVQVAERAGRPPGELLAELAAVGEQGLRARRRLPAPLRALPLPFGPPLGTRPLGYLMDGIYTRDAWLHRIDICRAVGQAPLLTADHDGRLVADVVDEWARAHRGAYDLVLTGPAGGTFRSGIGGQHHELDAVEFCRTLSGRSAGTGLLTTGVPF